MKAEKEKSFLMFSTNIEKHEKRYERQRRAGINEERKEKQNNKLYAETDLREAAIALNILCNACATGGETLIVNLFNN